MIRTLFISSALIGLTVVGGLGLSRAHSSAMGFVPLGGDVSVTSYRDLTAPQPENVNVIRALSSVEDAPRSTRPAPRLVIQQPGKVPTVSAPAIEGSGAPLVTTSLRPVARGDATTTVATARPTISTKAKPRTVYVEPSTYAMIRPTETPALPADAPRFLVGVYR